MNIKKTILILFCILAAGQLKSQFDGKIFHCDDNTFNSLKKLSESDFKNGDILIFTTTHQDIAWCEQPEVCIINRDTIWLTPFFERLKTNPDFKMDIEQSSIVMEYIHRHPEQKEFIHKNLLNGRICIGATYMQPYEELHTGESLARQFYLGKKWIMKTFPGYQPHSYFNVDVPGRTLQMPQISKKAGVDNLIISRHEKSIFNWGAPDGSEVLAYSSGHYIFFYNTLAKNDTAAVDELVDDCFFWKNGYNNSLKSEKPVIPAMLNYEYIWDQAPVRNLVPFTTKWNAVEEIRSYSGKSLKVKLPKFQYSIADDFMKRIRKTTKEFSLIQGERPNVWLYIHGPTHERAITANRKGDILLPDAEKIHSINALINKDMSIYPEEMIQKTWLDKIYPDHGWGGKNGHITDATFLEKYESAWKASTNLVNNGTRAVASMVQVKKDNSYPLVIFNMLSWKRADVVKTHIKLKDNYAKNIKIVDENGTTIPSQLSNTKYNSERFLVSADIVFVAKNIPSLGYKTYYIQADNSSYEQKNVESDFYAIELNSGGMTTVFDKELKCSILDCNKFKGAEIFTMKSEGTGAGEFDKVQLPTMQNFDKTSNYTAKWELVERGDVYSKYKTRTPIRNAVIEEEITVYNKIKKIDIDVHILNFDGTIYREYRMALPTAIQNGMISYEVPYGVLTVGKDEMPGAAGFLYKTNNADLRPRGIGDWISVSDANFGITMSSSAAVADYVDPTDNPASNTILQSVLLASRKSCHWEGNEYLQHGDHHYNFSITSHLPGWENGWKFGKQANDKLIAVFNPKSYTDASLPQTKSFFEINNDKVIITAIKKCDDDNSIIIRLNNLDGKETVVDLKSAFTPKKIIYTNLIEEEIEPVDKILLGKYAIETYKLVY